MGYGRTNYRRGYGSRPVTAGRVARVNARPGNCRSCGEEIPAGAGQLWREASGAWSVVHVAESQGGWLMNPQPVRGGCPEATDKRNAELHAAGFFGQGAVAFFGETAAAPVSEREHIASAARAYAARNAVSAPAQAGPGDDLREVSRRAGGKYAYTSSGARMTMSSRRCEDAPCCGCCD